MKHRRTHPSWGQSRTVDDRRLWRLVRRWDRYRVPKARSRVAWASWADDAWNANQRRVFDAEWLRQSRGEPSATVILSAGDPVTPGIGGVLDEPPRALTKAGRRRWVLAESLFAELVNSPYGVFNRGTELVVSSALPSAVDEAPGARRALEEAPGVVAHARPGQVRLASGTGGLVMRVHGPTWSLLFRVTPYVRPVLVCVDGLSKFAWRIDDDPSEQALIRDTITRVVDGLRRYDRAGNVLPEPPVTVTN